MDGDGGARGRFFGVLAVSVPLLVVFGLVVALRPGPEPISRSDAEGGPPEAYDRTYERAIRFARAGRFRESIVIFSEAEALHDGDHRLFFSRAEVRRALGRGRGALADIGRAYALHHQNEGWIDPGYALAYARMLIQHGGIEEARRILLALAANREPRPEVYRMLASLQMRFDRHREAAEVVRSVRAEVVELSADEALRQLEIRAELEGGRVDVAARIFEEWSPRIPRRWEDLSGIPVSRIRLRVELDLVRGGWVEVREALIDLAGSLEGRIEGLSPAQVPERGVSSEESALRAAYARVAFLIGSISAPDRAEVWFERAVVLGEGRARESRVALLRRRAGRGRYEEVREEIERYLDPERHDSHLARLLAFVLLRLGRTEEGFERIDTFVADFPYLAMAQAERVRWLAEAGDPARARRVLQGAIEYLAPDRGATALLLATGARLDLAGGRFQDAATGFLDAAEARPGDAAVSSRARLEAARVRSVAQVPAERLEASPAWPVGPVDAGSQEEREVRAAALLWRGYDAMESIGGTPDDWEVLAALDPTRFLGQGWFAILAARFLVGTLEREGFVARTAVLGGGLAADRDLLLALADERSGRIEEARIGYDRVLERDGLKGFAGWQALTRIEELQRR